MVKSLEFKEAEDFDFSLRAILDSLPIPTTLWFGVNQLVDCNQAMVDLFGLSEKKDYLENFDKLSPRFQPDGSMSQDRSHDLIKKTFEEGYAQFEWMHQKFNGDPVPVKVTLVRIRYEGKDAVASYTEDLRELKEVLKEMHEADERTQIMLDATPLCSNFWDENGNNIDCNEEAVRLFDLSSKHEYLERFRELSPEYQPDGRLSSEKAAEMVERAFNEGRAVFEWMHQKLNGELIPAEITLVRVKRGDSYIVAGYTRDLRELKKTLAEMREADERTQIMLDATPLCCNFWDENRNNIDCNEEAVKLFELKDKQEYLDRFFELSPEYQPDGRLSSEAAAENIQKAFDEGRAVFEWMHQKLDGEPIPSEITLVRVDRGDSTIVAGYTRDLRELKKTMAEMREADERTQIMLDATPLCCNLWDEDMNNIDCNQEAVNLFELKDKREYLDRFFELSPEFQPDGRLSSEKAAENIHKAFTEGRAVFEWMHQKLDGEPIPAEITLVRVKRGDAYIVAGYTRDLRELKNTVARLDHLEHLAFTDSGTGVYNRRYFIRRAEQVFAMGTADEANPMSIIMMDIDWFKSVNDTFGHLTGDKVLKAVADATQEVLRAEDVLARYGGEEFVIMVRETREGLTRRLAERIRSAIADVTVEHDGTPVKVTVSLGVAVRDAGDKDIEGLIDRADENLYKAKQSGRNRVVA